MWDMWILLGSLKEVINYDIYRKKDITGIMALVVIQGLSLTKSVLLEVFN